MILYIPHYLAMGLLLFPALCPGLSFFAAFVDFFFHPEASFPLSDFSPPLLPSLCNFYLLKSCWFIYITVEYCGTVEKWGGCVCADMAWCWRHAARWLKTCIAEYRIPFLKKLTVSVCEYIQKIGKLCPFNDNSWRKVMIIGIVGWLYIHLIFDF